MECLAKMCIHVHGHGVPHVVHNLGVELLVLCAKGCSPMPTQSCKYRAQAGGWSEQAKTAS